MEPISSLFGIPEQPIFSTFQDGFDLDAIKQLPLAFVLDSKGWLKWQRTPLVAGFTRLKELDGLATIKESCEYLPSKLPPTLFDKIVEFFRQIYRRQKSEAAGVLLYRVETREWRFCVPPQTATGGSANYDHVAESCQREFDEGFSLAGTVHSHGSMSAFHSGTDHKDEVNFDGLHITVGHLNDPKVEFAISVMNGGKRWKFDKIGDVVDYPESDAIEVPTEWLEAVKEPQKFGAPALISAMSTNESDFDLADDMAFAAHKDGKMSYQEYRAESKRIEKARKEFNRKIKDQAKTENNRFGFFDGRRFG